MSRQLEYRFDLPCTPDQAVALYTDPAFLEEEALFLGATEAHGQVVERTDAQAVVEVRVRAPNRDPRTRDKETCYKVRYHWNLSNRTCCWTRIPDKDDGVEVSGTHQATEVPTGSSYLMTWTLHVRSRLLRKLVEPKLASGLLEAGEKRAGLAARKAERAS